LLDEIGDNERHPLYDLLDTLGTLIHVYEETHHILRLNVLALKYFGFSWKSMV